MTATITETGYYDTPSERCALLHAGDTVTTSATLDICPAPCRSKQGSGRWFVRSNGQSVFVENENFAAN